jgi:protein TonB
MIGGLSGGVLGSMTAVAPPPPPPPTPVATPTRIQVGGLVEAANLIHQVVPVYPKLAHEARLGGVVRLKAVIARDGTIENLSVISGHPLLVPAAMSAVKQWLYKPTFLNGHAIEVDTEIDVTFALSS